MSQDSSYRWEQAYEAHKASGLTIREFHCTRAAEFCDGSYLPTYVTMTRHFRRLRLRGVQAAGNFQLVKLDRVPHTPARPTEKSSGTGPRFAGRGSTAVVVTLAGGARIEFSSCAPELFALAALGGA